MLSNEANALLELIRWVAKKNEQLYAVIGIEAIIRNLSKKSDDEICEHKVNDFLDELVREKLIVIEDFVRYKKYWLTNPIFSEFLGLINETLSELEYRGRSYNLTTHILDEDTLHYSIEIKYQYDLGFIIFPKFSEYLFSSEPLDIDAFMRNLKEKLINFEIGCIQPIIRNFQHAMHYLGTNSETPNS